MEIHQAGSGNTVGGTVAGAGNVIAANTGAGLFIFASASTVIQGNDIGTNAAGTTGLGNTGDGVLIEQASPNTVIGGVNPMNPDGTVKVLIGNVISGNLTSGIEDVDTVGGLVVQGNFIGTDPTGNVGIWNHYYGVYLNESNGLIGGTTPGSGNVISGSNSVQVFIDGITQGLGASGNLVEGNKIGTNYAGTAAITDLAGDGTGVDLYGADGNTVGGTTAAAANVISGHVQWGVEIQNGASNNLVEGNFIGTNLVGSAALPNGGSVNPGTPSGGVDIDSSAGNTIGGTVAGSGNLISGNAQVGVSITGNTATSNVLLGNLIGTNATGLAAIPNTGDGISLTSESVGTTIGGTSAGVRNIISGNSSYGVNIQGGYLNTSDVVEGNYIGVDTTGNAALPNAYGVLDSDGFNDTIGGTVSGAGNVISGNDGPGVYGASELETSGYNSLIAGNIIGLAANGATLSGAALTGIFVTNLGGVGNTIGGLTASARNVVSGNRQGITLFGDMDTLVEGNYIGTDLTGTVAIGNGPSTGSDDNVGLNVSTGDTIGGTTPAARNIISGASDVGVTLGSGTTNSVVEGNYIGTDKTGTVALPNFVGIYGGNTGAGNTIGGATSIPGSGAGNLIAGNSYLGLNFDSATSTGLIVQGNAIGVAALTGGGTSPANGTGILFTRSSGILIGGLISGDLNVISGNTNIGVELSDTAGSLIEGNLIGTNIAGNAAAPNSIGIQIDNASTNNTIGGTTSSALNVISGNTSSGVNITGTGTTGNVVEGDYVGTKVAGTASVSNGIGIVESGSGNTIGGTVAGAGNVIAGNDGTTGFGEGSQVFLNGVGTDLVSGNLIGLGSNGQAIAGSTGFGILVNYAAVGDTIGGITATARNVISGNQTGIYVDGGGANLIEGNYVGTDPTGTLAIGNGDTSQKGIAIFQGSSNTIGGTTTGAGNLISGNSGLAINILGLPSANNLIQGNFIGTDKTGTVALANGNGIGIADTAGGNTIGGATSTPGTGAGNLISGNFISGDIGISLIGDTTADFVQGNVVGGASPFGGALLPGNYVGIDVKSDTGAIVGGANSQDENLIAGSSLAGILIEVSSTANLVQGNIIGTLDQPNGIGIQIITGSSNNTIGGTASGAANVISDNIHDGVQVNDSTGNAIRANLIFKNGGLGIELGTSGVPLGNVLGGSQTGPNDDENYPVLTLINYVSGRTWLPGF